MAVSAQKGKKACIIQPIDASETSDNSRVMPGYGEICSEAKPVVMFTKKRSEKQARKGKTKKRQKVCYTSSHVQQNRILKMSKLQFSKVNSQHGAPMGRASYGSIPECFPRSVRLFRVNLDSQGYDDGGAYWGFGQPLWCAIGEHDTGCQSRAFVRAWSREDAIVELKIECGLLKQGPNAYRLNTLLGAATWGNDKAQALCDNLRDLGYTIYGFGYKSKV